MSSETPMLKQYNEIKKEYPDSILFFRLGDFYEMFYEDAKIASSILGITLTSRNKSNKNPVPLCGVPYHSVEPYLAKLLKSGRKIAICEQVEDPKQAKGVVQRKVVKVLSPGVILDSENLESKSNNYIASIYFNSLKPSISYCDVSTGEFKVTSFQNDTELISELSRLEPKELLLNENQFEKKKELASHIKNTLNPLITYIDDWNWEQEQSTDILKDHLGVTTLDSFGLNGNPGPVVASGVLLNYLKETQMDFMPDLHEPVYYSTNDFMEIDESTRRNLEIFRPLSGDPKGPSLINVIDKTVTGMGGRLMRQYMNYPLLDPVKINERLDAVEELKIASDLRAELTGELKKINDIERLIGRITTLAARPRDLGALRDSSVSITKLKTLTQDARCSLLKMVHSELDDFQDIREKLSSALVDEPPLSSREGGIIRKGFNSELDELKSVQTDGKKWISDLEAAEKEKTGINSLKVGYNRVFGYYIEVTKVNSDLTPEYYIRKQTLANAERYITPELKEFEEKIIGAQEKIIEIEKKLFEELRLIVAEQSARIRKSSALVAMLDVFCSLSEAASGFDYVRPAIDNGRAIDLRQCRHPVVERLELENGFVANDILIDNEQQFLLITGPNMAGKSTLIRQAAHIVILAQMGSFVPAEYAGIGIVDKVFTRVGASDNLAKGLSTFMVEMVETAFILRNSTDKSLVVLDEIGRGTSTFDGMSIAWAVAEYLHDLGAKTLFATHYHELAQLTHSKPRVKNFNVLVKEQKDKIIFLRKLEPGSSSHSYGIQVAKLAGVPQKVISSAKKTLSTLEKVQAKLYELMAGEQILLFEPSDEEVESVIDNELAEELRKLDPMNMTPLEALNKLIELKDKAG